MKEKIIKNYEIDSSLLLLKNILQMYIYHGNTDIKRFYTDRFITIIRMIEDIIEKDQLCKKGYDLKDVELIGTFIYTREIDKNV